MSTNSLQLNCNSQILTDEDVHFKLADRDKAQSSGEKTSLQYSSRFFFYRHADDINKFGLEE